MKEILHNKAVVFALREWLVRMVNTKATWRLNNGDVQINVNVFGFLTYIGIPFILLTKVLSAQTSSGDDFVKMLCVSSFEKNFNVLNKTNFTLGEMNPINVIYTMTLMEKYERNSSVDKINIEFLSYFSHRDWLKRNINDID